MSVIEEAAAWVAGLSYEDIPPRVLDAARCQILSSMGAVYAGAGSNAGRAIVDTVNSWGQQGPCAAYPSGDGRTFHSAIFQNSTLSMALDYDDYLFLAHTGHSAVFVPMATAEMEGAETSDMLVAQVAANEVAGRFGCSLVFGPHNGQMLAHVHLIGSAAAASRVLGLDAGQTADAMGIALAEPVYSLFPAFMGAESKALTAAFPALTGMMAAFAAGRGMNGPRSILEDPDGLWASFSFLPLPRSFSGFGRSWVTDTIAYKAYPGCAYIDTAVDALLDIMDRFYQERGRRIEPDEVKELTVEAGLLTVAMDGMSGDYLDRSRILPVNVNFSVALSLAVTLLAGELTGAQFTGDFLDGNREKILGLASRVSLLHDASLTVALLRSFDEALDLRAAMHAQVTLKGLARARRRIREHLARVSTMGPREAYRAWKSLSPGDRAFMRRMISPRGLLTPREHDFGDIRFEELRMPFAARVRVALNDGGVLDAERLVPRGAPGDPERFDVAVEKFTRESSVFMEPLASKKGVEVIMDLEARTLAEVREALCGTGGRGPR